MHNSVAVITGASRGLGRALAQACARRHMKIALLVRDCQSVDDLVQSLRVSGHEAVAIQCDVRNRAEIRDAVAETLRVFGRIDYCFLNAAIGGSVNFSRFDAEHYQRVIDTNLHGVVYAMEYVIPIMKAQQGGTIVGISSLADGRPTPGNGVYVASKAALTNILEVAAMELEEVNICVSCVRPGFIDTDLIADARYPTPQKLSADKAAEVIVRGVLRGQRRIAFPLGLTVLAALGRMLPASWWRWICRRFIS